LIYYTGDIHGSPANIVNFCKKNELGKNNTIVILGDVGANYFCDKRGSSVECVGNKK
jgi:predicted phosphodiesterase